ncbi:LicD family protein [Aminicella lysinilytica]|uniref:Phosphorylcholine metabolism protein LicD n=1 Tax=Aminicella lysinilytica TaxID=433323 RepID=A0A4R6Q916_9FIRM|nr:LicD family protein [Aminicella lysinilytica]TDP58557.1 phosphorylcholine metabolism protein LicD [Aminicella lysinilytica]
MNVIQKKSYELLKEVDDICNENDIEHYLGPTALGLAATYQGHSADSINLDVIIPASEMQAFVDAVNKENRTDRTIDYMGNYKNHLSFTIEYVDKTTTFLNMKQGTDVSCYGVKVTLLPLRRDVKGFSGTWAGVLETGWECNGYRFTKNITVKRIIATGIVRIAMIVGKGRLARHLFKKLCKVYSGRSELVAFKRPKQKQFLVDGKYYDYPVNVTFEGRQFKAPSDFEAILKAFYGPLWREKLLSMNKAYSSTIISSRVPYEDYLRECRDSGHDIRDLFDGNRRNMIDGAFVLKDFKAMKQAILIAKRSGDRLNFYEEFQQKREIIQNLYSNKNYDKLALIFAEHEEKTLFYLNKKLGFCVSKEYFDIQCDIFRYEGRGYIIDKLTKLIPEEHYKPIV